MGNALHRLQTQRGTGLSEARSTEIRVGSSTNGVVPVLAARRSLAADTRQWVSLGLVALSAIAADQLTKWIVSNELALGEEVDVVGPFSIHHVQNSGIAFGLFASRTTNGQLRCGARAPNATKRSASRARRRRGRRSPPDTVPPSLSR